MDMLTKNQEVLASILFAYSKKDIRAAIKKYALFSRRMKIDSVDSVPEGWNWTKVNGKIIAWEPVMNDEEPAMSQATRPTKKMDTSASPGPVEIKCPSCGGEFFKEPVCPGCSDGKKGYRIRLHCGECDKTILL